MFRLLIIAALCMFPLAGTGQCYDSTQVVYGGYCDPRWEPVCGCDGYTYRNDCFARNAGLISWTYTICDYIDFDFLPNPPIDYVTVDAWLKLPEVMYVELIDRFGKVYYTNVFQGSDHYIFQVDFRGYPQGIYYLHCYTSMGSRVKKVLKADDN